MRNQSKHMKNGRHKNRGNQHGFSMIEVLVSLLLMTIGLLGISGLIMNGINNTTGFDIASRASQSANEIMDAMRANSSNATSYVTAYGTDPTTLTATTPQDTDRKRWLLELKKLPGGDGKIEAIAANPGEFLITVRFSNCLGTLSATERSNCIASTNNNEKRQIEYRFKI
jgi:type IV pilus assembly protein PilV